MKRRHFIQQIASLSAGTVLLPNFIKASGNSSRRGKLLKGFIVSDAHFGWDGNDQPTPEKQKQAMESILSRFPDLDVLIDTGDAHHNDHHNNLDPYKARADWVNIIQGGCGQLPFYFVVGNHEIRSNEDDDPEMRSNIMGSNTCRPYYSFDLMGIHFISFPQLIRTIHITEEAWDWLALDIEVNRDKTIIMLSHNNVIGTTRGNAPGYRGLMENDRMLQVFRDHPNIIAWMHGHNHNYEIVNQNNMLFVSNGRIGGFDPSRGEYGIGGIYFEVSSDYLAVRCYSAEKDIFLDEFDASLSQSLDRHTSFDSEAAAAYSYGVGGASHGERIPAHHHHISQLGQSELFLTGCSHPYINEDLNLSKYVERQARHGLDKILLAARVNHGNEAWEFLNPGIRLKANSNWWTTVTLPSDNYYRHTYYRCSPGKEYEAGIKLNVEKAKNPITEIDGQRLTDGRLTMWLRLHVHDMEGRKLRIVQSDPIPLLQGRQAYERIIKVPELNDRDTIYSNPDSDNLVNIAIEVSISGMNMSDVDIHGIYLKLAGADGLTSDPGLLIDGVEYAGQGILKQGDIRRVPINNPVHSRSVIEIIAGGNKRLAFLIRQTGQEWQVRNATAVYDKGHIQISKLRNKLSDRSEIVIVPLGKASQPFLHRVRKTDELNFLPYNTATSSIEIDVSHLTQIAELDIWSLIKPKDVLGVLSWTYDGQMLKAKVDRPGKVLVHF